MENWVVYIRGDVASFARDAGYKAAFRNGQTAIYIQAVTAAAAVEVCGVFGNVLDWRPRKGEDA